MPPLYFATQNLHKLQEAQAILGQSTPVLGLSKLHQAPLEEPFSSLKENAAAKAQFISEKYRIHCFSEDTGLFVSALQGAPGVHTARYAGPRATDAANCHKLLQQLRGKTQRKAYFCSIIAFCQADSMLFFEGYCYGSIATAQEGTAGFGYDPLFIPDGSTCTFSGMSGAEKNKCSHRKKALEAFRRHLCTENTR